MYGVTSKTGVSVMPVYTENPSGAYVVSVDWFQMSCSLSCVYDGHPLVAPNGWQCLRMSSTAVWSERWFVLDVDGNKVATLLFAPRTPKIPATACNVQIANRYLYYADFRQVCDDVLGILPMAVHGLTRVDLCCDFEMTPQMYDTYTALARHDARLKGLREGVAWWKDIPVGTRGDGQGLQDIPNQLNWGGTDSTFKWKVYYKWLELETAPPEDKKPWIQAIWSAMGMEARACWRCEVSVSDTNSLRRLTGDKVLAFDWYEQRDVLFSDLYADKFIVRRKEGHRDKRNDTVLPFLNIVGHKALKHALPVSSRDGSDPEKRMACKLWAELQQVDVQANRALFDLVASTLSELLQRPSNVWVLRRMYGVDIEGIVSVLRGGHALQNAPCSPQRSATVQV